MTRTFETYLTATGQAQIEMLDNLSDGLWVKALHGSRDEWVSDKLLSLLGYSPTDDAPPLFGEFALPEDFAAL